MWVELLNILIVKNLLVFNVGICICLYKIELLFGIKIKIFWKCVWVVYYVDIVNDIYFDLKKYWVFLG